MADMLLNQNKENQTERKERERERGRGGGGGGKRETEKGDQRFLILASSGYSYLKQILRNDNILPYLYLLPPVGQGKQLIPIIVESPGRNSLVVISLLEIIKV